MSAKADGSEVFGTAASDCFNALATLVREILYALASCARLKPRVRSRSKAGRSISIGLRPKYASFEPGAPKAGANPFNY